MTVWKYKSGQREKALDTLKKAMATDMSGFRGDLILLSSGDPDSEVIVTLWEDEGAMKASAKQIWSEGGGFVGAFSEMEKFLAAPVGVTTFRVYEAEVQKVTPETAKPA